MAAKALQFIHAVARKLLAKPAKPGEGITSIVNRMQAEAKAGEIAETFRASGLTPDKWDEFIKSEKDVLKYLNIIESTKPVTREVSKDILKVPGKGEVVDLTGKKIKPDEPIMGGKGYKIETEAEKKLELDKLLGPDDDVFGSPIKDWHMEKFKKPGAKDVTPIKQTEKQIKSRLEAGNKSSSQIGRAHV